LFPKLRFKKFDGDWTAVTLESLAEVERGKFSVRPRNDPRYFGGEMPFIQTGDVTGSDVYLKGYTQTLNDDGIRVSKVFPADTILITIAANIGDTTITQYPVACPDSVVAIQPKQDKVNTIFLKNVIDLQKDNLDSQATQNAQKNINLQVLKPLKLIVPLKEEQTQIASFLSAVDEKISQLTQKLELLCQYKQGMMQKLFSQQIRFKADDGSEFGEWDYLELNEVLDYEQPTKYIVKSTDYDSSYLTPVLTAGKTFILGYTNETSGIFEGDKENVIIFDDFTTAYKFVNFRFKVKSSAMKILKLNHFQNNIFYIYSVFSLLNLPLGDEHKRRWISEYSKQEIPVPCLEEQTKISNFLSAIDQKIEVVAQQIEQAKQWKKGLLQQMFV
jgi:type I restriction enzyme S subunit